MIKKFRRLKRTFRRAWPRRRRLFVAATVTVLLVVGVWIDRSTMEANYSELLSTIAEGESKGNYNAYYGHAGNTRIKFTDMTVDEVLDWQVDYVKRGNPSSAVGKYQFIQPTLLGLVDKLKIDRGAKFNPALQDRLAIELLKRRGVEDYLRGRISREQFAHNLSMEWAALPRVLGSNPQASYYAGDGLNKVQISIDQVVAAIETLNQYEKS